MIDVIVALKGKVGHAFILSVFVIVALSIGCVFLCGIMEGTVSFGRNNP